VEYTRYLSTGWHIPTIAEFGILATVNNDNDAVKAVGQGKGYGTAIMLAGFRVANR